MMSSNLDTFSRGLLWRNSLIYLLSTITPHLSKLMENSNWTLCTISCTLNPYMPCSIIKSTAPIRVIIAMVNILLFVSNGTSASSKINNTSNNSHSSYIISIYPKIAMSLLLFLILNIEATTDGFCLKTCSGLNCTTPYPIW